MVSKSHPKSRCRKGFLTNNRDAPLLVLSHKIYNSVNQSIAKLTTEHYYRLMLYTIVGFHKAL